MKKFSFVLLLIFAFSLQLKAQFNDGFHYERIDSVYRLGEINNVFETPLYYYAVGNYEVYQIDKVNQHVLLIYQSIESLISCSILDSTGNIGIVTGKKLMLYDGQAWQSVQVPCGNIFINQAMVDFDNRIYFGAYSDSLYIYDNTTWIKKRILGPNNYFTSYKMLPGPNHEFRFHSYDTNPTYVMELQGETAVLITQLHAGYSTVIHYDSNARLWFSKNGKIYRKNTLNEIDSLTIPSQYNAYFYNYTINKSGDKIWLTINNLNQHLVYFDGISWMQLTNNFDLSGIDRRDFFLLSDHKLAEYMSYPSDEAYLVIRDDSLPENVISGMQQLQPAALNDILNVNFLNSSSEIQNQVLIASNVGLISKATNLFNNYTVYKIWDMNNTALPTSNLLCMTTAYNEYSTDTIYLGTDHGLVVSAIVGDSLIVYRYYNTQNSTLPSDTITSIQMGYNGTNVIWLGTQHRGLIKYDLSGNFQAYNSDNSILPSNHVNAISTNMYSSDVLVTTNNGFVRIANNTLLEVFTPNNSCMIHHNISFVSKNGSQYAVGSYGGGLAMFDDINQWIYYNTSNSALTNDTVYYLQEQNYPFYDISFIGTGKGIQKLSQDNSGNIIFEEVQISNAPNNLYHKKKSANYFLCGASGNKLVSLSEKGIVSFITCLSGIEDTDETVNDKILFWGGSIHIHGIKNGRYLMELYSIEGKKIISENILFNTSYSREFPNLSEGVYLIKLTDEHQIMNAKIVCTS
jgi:hypothetical protein